jgi:hypothetical protein
VRCYACNRGLSDYESTLRSATTGEYLDTCLKCLKDLDISTVNNSSNNSHTIPDEDDEFTEEDDVA